MWIDRRWSLTSAPDPRRERPGATLQAMQAHRREQTGRARRGCSCRRGAIALPSILLLFPVLAALLVGCADRGPTTQVDDGPDAIRSQQTAPEFPEDGRASRDLLVQGIVFDLTHGPQDSSFWAAPTAEARCVAESVVDDLGEARLNELGYRPGESGSSLNDIGLSDEERNLVVDRVQECLDVADAVAAMFFGNGRMGSNVASCLADGLEKRGQLRPFVVAIAFGRSVDPSADGGALASALLDQATICVPSGAFNWTGLNLPGGPVVLDSDAAGGMPGSPYLDDQLQPSVTATTAVP